MSNNLTKTHWRKAIRQEETADADDQDAMLTDLGAPKVSIPQVSNSLRQCFWGHSFWGSSASSDPPEQIWINYAYQCFNGGVGGETSTQIRTRFDAADPSLYKWPTHFWLARNNITDLVTVMADLTHMVGVLEAAGNFEYIIYTDCPKDEDIERPGTTLYNAVAAYRDAIVAYRPDHVFDAWQWGVNLADPSIPQDVIDKSNNVWPARLRRDSLHANQAMNILIGDQVVRLVCQRFRSAQVMIPGWALPALMQKMVAKRYELNLNARTDNYRRLAISYNSSSGHFILGSEYGTGGSSTALVIAVNTVANNPEAGLLYTITPIAPYFQWSMGTVGASGPRSRISGTITGANSGSHFNIAPIYNQSSTAAATDLLISRTETAVGSGQQLFIDCQVGGTSKFRIDNAGGIFANLPTYADNATAAAAGKAVGTMYKTATGEVRTVV